MSTETLKLLLDSLDRVLTDRCTPRAVQAADAGGFDAALWSELAELGFAHVGLGEDAGGAGLTPADWVALLRLAGRHCAPVPLLESAMLAAPLLAGAGFAVPQGVLTFASVPDHQTGLSARGTVLRGTLAGVPFGRYATHLVLLLSGGGVGLAERASLRVNPGDNLAGEARDDIQVEGLVVVARPGRTLPDVLAQRAALGRAALMTGALQRALELAVEYTRGRKQFGRPLAAFQAVQQQLAILAAEVTAAATLTDYAGVAATESSGEDAIAAAKVRAGQAAGLACRIAHQVHGAMGFTQEYPLHHATRRLWAWREEDGSEASWATRLGGRLAAGPDALWAAVTRD